LAKPWFVDPVDKTTMISAINDLVAQVGNGMYIYSIQIARVNLPYDDYNEVPNLALITPDNQTTITDHGQTISVALTFDGGSDQIFL
jgi:cellobiose dehydrogenase (acceptor)